MHESQILDIVESLTMNTLSLDEKAIIVADVKSEITNKRLAGSTTSLILEKINDLGKGFYKEAQALPKTFQDFSETSDNSTPFAITNMDEINEFLDKMASKKPEENVESWFGDTWEFYHPIENMNVPGVPRHRADFNTQY